MKTFRAKLFVVALMGAGIAPLAYSQTAPKDILPPTTVAHPPVSPTLNVTTPDNVPMPPVTPTVITPQAPAAPAQSIPQVSVPGVVETNKLETAANGRAVGQGTNQTSLWTQTNAASRSVWEKTTTAAAGTTPSTAKPATDQWSVPPPNVWNSGTQLGSSGTKTDWK